MSTVVLATVEAVKHLPPGLSEIQVSGRFIISRLVTIFDLLEPRILHGTSCFTVMAVTPLHVYLTVDATEQTLWGAATIQLYNKKE